MGTCLMPLATNIFCYIMVVSLLGVGNWSIQRKPLSYHTLLTNLSHIVVLSTPNQGQ